MRSLLRAGTAAIGVTLAGVGLLVAAVPGSAAVQANTAYASVTSQLGSSVNSPADITRLSQLMGRQLTSFRVFLDTPPAAWSRSSTLASMPANATVALSFKGGTPAQVQTFLAGHPAATTCYATYHHEPEDNFTTAEAKARYEASWDAYAPAIRAAGCIPTMILMKWSLNPKSGRDWHDWYFSQDMDAIAFDAYDTKLNSGDYSDPARYLAPVLAAAAVTHRPWALTEVGSFMSGNASQRATWAHGVAVEAMAHGARFADWWDASSFDGKKDYRLDSATALAWQSTPVAVPSYTELTDPQRPAVTSAGGAPVELFVRSSAGHLLQQSNDLSSGGWTTAADLGGTITSAPSVASWPSGGLDVVARGADGAVWQRYFGPKGWSSWQSLGGRVTSAPAIVSAAPGRLDVVARGADGATWHRWFVGGRWSDWQSLGGRLSSAPSIASWATGTLEVLARSADGAIWQRFYSRGRWSSWQSLNGRLTSAPAVASMGAGRLEVVARGTDGAVWHRSSLNGHWSVWQSLGGRVGSAPALTAVGTDSLTLAARGGDGAVWQRTYASGGWSAWSAIAGSGPAPS